MSPGKSPKVEKSLPESSSGSRAISQAGSRAAQPSKYRRLSWPPQATARILIDIKLCRHSAPSHDHGQAAFWSQSHSLDRPRGISRNHFKREMAHDRSDHNGGFLNCKRGADADSRPYAERKINKTINFSSPIAKKTAGIENVGLGPKCTMTMQHVRRNDDDGAGLNLFS